MGSLIGSLLSTSGAMRAFEKGLTTSQNNVVNVNTPGFVKQRAVFEAEPFQPENNIMGGVASRGLINYRDTYSERNVQRRSTLFSFDQERATRLQSIESVFPVGQGQGIASSLNRFFGAVSQLTVAPNDTSSRRVALERASDVAFTFRRSANLLLEQRGATQISLSSSVERINSIATRIRDINASRRGDSQASSDPAADAKLYAALEELSEVVDFDAIRAPDGSMSVYLGGQALLVIGDRQYNLSTDIVDNRARILNSDGAEITDRLSGGKLVAQIDLFNNRFPDYLDELNTLAIGFADQINSTLAQGIDQNGNIPTTALFSYDGTLGAAYTLQASELNPDQLALAAPGDPGGNQNAIQLADLAKKPLIENQTFVQYYGLVAGQVGRELAAARDGAALQGDLLSQARELRADLQQVSLDEEATYVLQFQRSYQATAQLFRTINELTETILNIMR
ncbi:MAG: flagellar hook-associated protein FlgK [Acidobacteriota bacterium]